MLIYSSQDQSTRKKPWLVLWARFGLAMLVFTQVWSAWSVPLTTHPRLWVTQADIPRLQSWAANSNPMYTNGLASAAAQAVHIYDTEFAPNNHAQWQDLGISNWVVRCSEGYAQFFAFMSLVEADPVKSSDYAQRARTLLMYVIDEAVKGATPNVNGNEVPFRSPVFITFNRANYWGEAFPLAVDWIQYHPEVLSATDKAKIRAVFLRWSNECLNASTTSGEHPQPVGVTNSPELLSNLKQLRWTANNYYTGHMRQITLMSLSLDAADDPPLNPAQPDNQLGNSLRSYIDNVLGAWLYQQYAVYEEAQQAGAALGVSPTGLGIAAGGLSVEGFLYGHALSYLHEALLGLYTAGYRDAGQYGPQLGLIDSGYWNKFVDGFFHSIPFSGSVPDPASGYAYMGQLFQIANYGDVLRAWASADFVSTFGSLGIYDQLTGNQTRLQKEQWIAINTMEGGPASLYSRAANVWGNTDASRAILYFLLFPPDLPAPADPRPALPTEFYAAPLGRLLARTDWTPQASWLTYICCWNSINHQNGCGNQFEFYRKGEWLVKERSGYANDNVGATPDFHNTLSVMNDVPAQLFWFEGPISARGGQWKEGLNTGDPTAMASWGASYAYAQGDATNLYNRWDQWNPQNRALDVAHCSRSLLWLKPDHVIIYDRAKTNHSGRFKRFNLCLTANAAINEHQADILTPGGQHLYLTSLLPAGAVLSVTTAENFNQVAELEPTRFQLAITDPSNPADIRFLNVLQGADQGVSADQVQLLQNDGGVEFDGVLVRQTMVWFARDLSAPITSMTYTVPGDTQRHYVTGLASQATYTIDLQSAVEGYKVTISPGGAVLTDQAGVLMFDTTPTATNTPTVTVNDTATPVPTFTNPTVDTVTPTETDTLTPTSVVTVLAETPTPDWPAYDHNLDGRVDAMDLYLLMRHWHATGG